MGLVRQLIDKKTLKILDFLLKKENDFYHLSQISKESRIPLASTFRIMNSLTELRITEIMLLGKMKIYKLSQNQATKELELNLKNNPEVKK